LVLFTIFIKAKNSNAMEKEGYVRILSRLIDEGVEIETISTDRHSQIRALMKNDERFNHINHSIDPWHVIKGLVKKKGCENQDSNKID